MSSDQALDRERFASRVAEILDSSLNLAEKFKQLTDAFVPSRAELCLIDLLEPDGTIRLEAVSAADPAVARDLAALRARAPVALDGNHPVARVLRSGEPERLILDTETLPSIAQSAQHLSFMIRRGYSEAIVVPLRDRESTLGVLSVLRLGEGRRFEDSDLPLVEEVSRRAAQALTNARLYERARAAVVRATFLAEASAALDASLGLEETLATVAELAVTQVADWCSIDLADPAGGMRNVAVANRDPSKAAWATQLRRKYPVDMSAEIAMPRVLRTGRSEFYPEVSEDLLRQAVPDREQFEILRRFGIRSAIIAPLAARGQTFGVLTLIAAAGHRPFTEEDHLLARDLARRAGLSLDNARLYEERSHLARTLERGLLPDSVPEVPGIEIALRYRAARAGQEVGGDFYDVFRCGRSRWAVVVGDVCGKGPESAALTSMGRFTLRAYALDDLEPAEALRRLNAAMLHQRTGSRFLTVAYARLDPDEESGRCRVELAVAGHPPPLLLKQGRAPELLEPRGPAVGLFQEAEVGAAVLELGPGDALVLYSDGLLAGAHASILDPVAALAVGEEARASAEELADGLEREYARRELRDDVVVAVVRSGSERAPAG